MADSAFWKVLAEDFAKLPAQGIFVRWQYTSGTPGRWKYTTTGDSKYLQLTFERLARKAGAALDERGEKDSLEVWLEELRTHDNDPRNQGEIVGPEVLADGTKVFHQLGKIPNASELSASRGIEVAMLKMEAERRSKGGHRGPEEGTRKRGRRPKAALFGTLASTSSSHCSSDSRRKRTRLPMRTLGRCGTPGTL